MSEIKSIDQATTESTCQKRITMVEIYDEQNNLLSRESNRCNPSGGTCHRIGVFNGKENYPADSHCNWTHAEIMAIKSLPENSKPYKAILYGHDFYCEPCETALKNVGVKIFEVA